VRSLPCEVPLCDSQGPIGQHVSSQFFSWCFPTLSVSLFPFFGHTDHRHVSPVFSLSPPSPPFSFLAIPSGSELCFSFPNLPFRHFSYFTYSSRIFGVFRFCLQSFLRTCPPSWPPGPKFLIRLHWLSKLFLFLLPFLFSFLNFFPLFVLFLHASQNSTFPFGRGV